MDVDEVANWLFKKKKLLIIRIALKRISENLKIHFFKYYPRKIFYPKIVIKVMIALFLLFEKFYAEKISFNGFAFQFDCYFPSNNCQ